MTVTTMRDVLPGFKSCRLCWRVTCAVFLIILSIEALILTFSVLIFEQEKIFEVEHEALVIARAILRSVEPEDFGTDELARQAAILSESTVLSGMQILDRNSQVLGGFGDLPSKFIVPKLAYLRDVTVRRPVKDGTRMDIIWPDFRTRSPNFVVARVGTYKIGAQVTAYTWRIVGIAALATVSLMIAIMVVLAKLILTPILSLRLGLQEIVDDSDGSKSHELPIVGGDEIRETISGVNTLSARLTDAVRTADQ